MKKLIYRFRYWLAYKVLPKPLREAHLQLDLQLAQLQAKGTRYFEIEVKGMGHEDFTYTVRNSNQKFKQTNVYENVETFNEIVLNQDTSRKDGLL